MSSRGKCVEKLPCHKCGSSDGLQVFEDSDGSYNGWCYPCSTYFKDPYSDKPEDYVPPEPKKVDLEEVKRKLEEVRELPTMALESRKLKKETLEHFGVRIGLSQQDGKTPALMFFPHFRDGNVVSVKTKLLDPKRVWWIGEKKDVEPFGWRQALDSGSSRLFITEGEPDTLAVAQVLSELEKHPDFKGRFPAVISLTDGASSIGGFLGKWLPEMKRNFKEIIYIPDSDDAGRLSATTASKLDPTIKIARLPDKDPNKMLIEGRKKALKNALVFNADVTKLDKVCTVADLLEDAVKMPEWGFSFPWDGVTQLTYGFRRTEIYGLGAGTGMGKTTWAQALQTHIVNIHGNPIGVFMLEQPAGRTLKGIAGKFAGIPFHRPDAQFTEKQLRDAVMALDGKVFVYNNFGVIDWDSVKTAVRYMNTTYGVRDFFIDNMTCFVSHVSSSEANDILNHIFGDMASLALELDITFFYFSHLNSPKTGNPHERGGHVHEGQFTGSRAAQRYSHYIFGLEGNKDPLIPEAERNTRKFVMLKDREFGKARYVPLSYNPDTDQLTEMSKEDYEEGVYDEPEAASEHIFPEVGQAPWD